MGCELRRRRLKRTREYGEKGKEREKGKYGIFDFEEMPFEFEEVPFEFEEMTSAFRSDCKLLRSNCNSFQSNCKLFQSNCKLLRSDCNTFQSNCNKSENWDLQDSGNREYRGSAEALPQLNISSKAKALKNLTI